MTTLQNSPRKSRGSFFLIFLLILAGLCATVFFLFFEGKAPVAAILSPEKFLGAQGTISLTAEDTQSGLRHLALTVTQGDESRELLTEDFPRSGYTGLVGTAKIEKKIIFKPKDLGLTDGPVTLTLQVSDYSARGFLKGNKTTITRDLTIDTTAPKITISHSEKYISPGGSGIVIYRLEDENAESGLQINEDFHPGFPVGDGRADTFIAYFGLRYDTEKLGKSMVIAEDQAGNRTQVPFSVTFKNVVFKTDEINVGDGFLDSKIPEFQQYYPEMQGSMIEKYLFTNNEVRTRNNNQISDLCKNPHAERLWAGRFLRMSGSSRAGYADHRTYFYNGNPVDKQVHLGMDLASTQNADVKAAEKGLVVYADYLGIYGNMVLLDHGQGVFSLYSHLSHINVSPGDTLAQGAVLGLTGTTGMAGGDHLHFSMLINGIFVTPKEWWDQHWIDVTIEDPLMESRF